MHVIICRETEIECVFTEAVCMSCVNVLYALMNTVDWTTQTTLLILLQYWHISVARSDQTSVYFVSQTRKPSQQTVSLRVSFAPSVRSFRVGRHRKDNKQLKEWQNFQRSPIQQWVQRYCSCACTAERKKSTKNSANANAQQLLQNLRAEPEN